MLPGSDQLFTTNRIVSNVVFFPFLAPLRLLEKGVNHLAVLFAFFPLLTFTIPSARWCFQISLIHKHTHQLQKITPLPASLRILASLFSCSPLFFQVEPLGVWWNYFQCHFSPKSHSLAVQACMFTEYSDGISEIGPCLILPVWHLKIPWWHHRAMWTGTHASDFQDGDKSETARKIQWQDMLSVTHFLATQNNICPGVFAYLPAHLWKIFINHWREYFFSWIYIWHFEMVF